MIDRAKRRDEVVGLLRWTGRAPISPREEKILRMLYGTHGEDVNPPRDVGFYFDIGSARVRQIEIGAIVKLRERREVERRLLLRGRP